MSFAATMHQLLRGIQTSEFYCGYCHAHKNQREKVHCRSICVGCNQRLVAKRRKQNNTARTAA